MEHSRKLDARYKLHKPPLEEVAKVLESALLVNFKEASVVVEESGDLSQPPFNLAAPGICGGERIADIGGPGNLFPKIRRDKIFDLKTVLETVELPNGFAIGPGAGPFHKVGVNSEMMANCFCGGTVINRTFIAKIRTEDGGYVQESVPHGTTEFGLMANLLVSEGKPGKVLHVKAKHRTGEENFVSCMRKGLGAEFGEKPVGVGGAFIVKEGKAKLHVMPDFPAGDFPDKPYIGKEWLQYFDMSSPLVCLSVFHSHDPGYDLRDEHTHCFSDHGDAGHYHYDTTPEEVEYEGFFTLANEVFRIDQVADP